jgi:Tol biopolymer transport system component
MKIRSQLLFEFLLLVVAIPMLSFGTAASEEEAPVFRDIEMIRDISPEKLAGAYRAEATAVSVPAPLLPDVSGPPFPSRTAFQALRNNNWDIYIKDHFGSANAVRVTSETATESSPSLKHGATQVAFVTDRDGNDEIYRIDISGANLFNISHNSQADLNPSWSRDGARIAFNSFRTGNSEIYTVNSDGSGLLQLTNHPAYDGQPSWSLDGTQIVFTSLRSGRYELWLMNADGSNLRQLTFGATALYPAWSPKGDQIAYANDGDGDGWLELWLINVDGTAAHKLVGGGALRDFWLPAWSPDGNAISFTGTSWTYHQGQFYWTSSYIYNADPHIPDSYSTTLIYDNTAFRSSWASLDASGPDPCLIRVAEEQHQPAFIVSWTATDVGAAGVKSYQVQTRQGSTGPWQTLIVNAPEVATRFQVNDGLVQFRCRAQDHAYNWGAWGEPAATVINTRRPNSHVLPLPRQAQSAITVHWTGNTPGMAYRVFVRDGRDGNWEVWQNNVTHTSAPFTGMAGHTYYFRSQARTEKQLEPWQANPDTAVSFYTYTLSGFVKDNRGYPVAEPTINLSPAPVDVAQNLVAGAYELYAAGSGNHNLSFVADGHSPLPDTAVSITANTAFNAFMSPAIEGILNGGFEVGDLDDWTVTGSGATAATSAHHTGNYGLLINHPAAAETAVTQTVTIENRWDHPTLSFLYHIPASLSGGVFQVQLANGTDPVMTVLDTAVATSSWQHVWADLTAYSGQTIKLTLTANHASGAIWLDEFSVGPWQTPQITAVSPTDWQYQHPATLVITGSNFINTPSVFLNEIALDNVVWVSDSRLEVSVPATHPEGNYMLTVINPSGNKAIGSQTITIAPKRLFLPIISKPGTPDTADWPSLGYNAGHTGYNPVDPGASRYSLRWSQSLPFPGGTALQNIAISNKMVVATSEVLDQTSAIIAFDLETGVEKWRKEMNGYSLSPPTIAHGAVYVVQNSHGIALYKPYAAHLYALDVFSGQELWQKLLDTTSSGGATSYYRPIAAEDKLFIGGRIYLIGVEAFAGQELWRTSYGHRERWTPSYGNGVVYTWSNVYFSNILAANGQNTWSVDTGQSGQVSVVTEHRAVLSSDTTLIGVNLDSQAIAWSLSGTYARNMVATAGGVLYSLNGQRLEARNLSNGSLLWHYDTDVTLINAPVIAGNYVYIASEDKSFVINRTTHQLEWTTDKGGWLAVANGYLFVADRNKIIYAYRAEES